MTWLDDLNEIEGTMVFAGAESIHLYPLEGFFDRIRLVTSTRHSWVDLWRKMGVRIFCLEEHTKKMLTSTRELIQHSELAAFLDDCPKPIYLLMFKPDVSSENFLKTHQIIPLNASAELSRRLENKLFFSSLALEAGVKVLHSIDTNLDDSIQFNHLNDRIKTPFIVQFAKGFSGNRTFFITNREEFDFLRTENRDRRCKITPWIAGETWTCNGCVEADGHTSLTPAFYQITKNAKPSEDSPETVGSRGNLWISPEIWLHMKIRDAMKKFGRVLTSRGFSGLFGMDFLAVPSEHEMYAIEINPRLTASVPILTPIEIRMGVYPLLIRHIRSICGKPVGDRRPYEEIPAGGQLIYRQGDEIAGKLECSFLSGKYSIQEEMNMERSETKLVYLGADCSPGAIKNEEALIWSPETKSKLFNEMARLIFRSSRLGISNLEMLETAFIRISQTYAPPESNFITSD